MPRKMRRRRIAARSVTQDEVLGARDTPRTRLCVRGGKLLCETCAAVRGLTKTSRRSFDWRESRATRLERAPGGSGRRRDESKR